MLTKSTYFNKKNCFFCKINQLKYSTTLISLHAIKNEHNFYENCHEYCISKIHCVLCWLLFLTGVYSIYFNCKLLWDSTKIFEAKINTYYFMGSLIATFLMLFLTPKSSIYTKYLESTSRLREYSTFIGKDLINAKETQKIIKEAKYLLLASTINLLVLILVLSVEMYWFGMGKLTNRIGIAAGYYFVYTYAIHVNIQIKLTLNFLKKNYWNFKQNLKSRRICNVEKHNFIGNDIMMISRLHQAVWRNFMKGFSYWKFSSFCFFTFLFINNINFLSMLVDFIFFNELCTFDFLRDFLVLGIVSFGTFSTVMVSVLPIKKMEDEVIFFCETFLLFYNFLNFKVQEILTDIFKYRCNSLNKLEALKLEMIINTFELKQPSLSFYNIFTADLKYATAVSEIFAWCCNYK